MPLGPNDTNHYPQPSTPRRALVHARQDRPQSSSLRRSAKRAFKLADNNANDPRPAAKRVVIAGQADFKPCHTLNAIEFDEWKGYVFFQENLSICLNKLRLVVHTHAQHKTIDITLTNPDHESVPFIPNTRPNTFSARIYLPGEQIITESVNVIYMPKNRFYTGNDVRLKYSYIRFGPDERQSHIFYPIGSPHYHP